MKYPKLHEEVQKGSWSHADIFGDGELEYIRYVLHKNYSMGYHTHSFYELNIVESGEGYHYIEHMACNAKRGSVFLIPPHIRHGYINKNKLNVHHLLIHRDFIDRCFNEFKQTTGYFLLFEIEPYLRAHYEENVFLTLSEEKLREITLDFDMISECSTLPQADVYINAAAKKLLCRLCMLIAKQHGVEQDKIEARRELLSIADCLNYIHQNYDEKLTIEHLAKRMNMSRSTFIRHFSRICGCSPHRYITIYRVKKAEECMKSSGMTATRTAQECGFYDISHMRKYINKEKSDGQRKDLIF